MRSPKLLFLLVSSFFFSFVSTAQDKIYSGRFVIECRIISINSKTVSYHSLFNSLQSFVLPTDQVQLVFNQKGDFLLPDKLDTTNEKQKRLIEQFFSADTSHPVSDQIFTSQKIRIEGHIDKEDSNFVYFSDTLKLNRKYVAVIIYRSGRHRLLVPVDSAAAVLQAVQQGNSGITDPAASAINQAAKNDSVVNTALVKPVNPDTSVHATEHSDSARQKAFSQLAGNISRKDFEDRAVQKTNKLNEYLKILCSKTTSYENSNEAIDQAVNLFVNENALVETSSIKKNVVNHYKIREYLTRVKLFKYDKIEIEWTHVQYVSDLKMGADGNFYGVVTFEQVFRGYRDNQLIYSDITRKNANVVLKTYNKNYEGSTKTIWDVLLSDIGVVYTKSSDNNN